ncbi:MAG: hypothetical protein ABR555_02175 [Pyrinomonadaceae bacterium]
MRSNRSLLTAVFLLLIFSVSSIPTGLAKPKDKKVPNGTPILWRRPADITGRDLYLGPGGAAMRPDVRQLTFIKEEKGGYSKKYRVRDASGREWVVKIGKEAQSETSAVRLLWGLGYETEINYLVPHIYIPGKGSFDNARFEARPEGVKRTSEWKWKRNPFVNTPELQGLKILMALMNNWDMKDSNNQILVTRANRENQLHYIISDLGATFGHASTTPFFWRITRSRNNPTKFVKTKFLEKVKSDRVYLHYGGKNRALFKNVTTEDAEWIGRWLAQLTDRQVRDAFRAANYTPSQIELLTRAIRQRANELVDLRSNEPIGRNK